jgi:hypothetical protein
MKKVHIPVLLSAFMLSSCVTMSPEECTVARWDDVGMRDGLQGKALSRLESHSKTCAEAGVAVDGQAYLKAREIGIRTYCQPANALKLGLEGKYYESSCPAEMELDFRRRYDVGSEYTNARKNLESQDSRLHGLEKALAEAKTDEERKRLREDLRQQDGNLRRARDRVRAADAAFDRLR